MKQQIGGNKRSLLGRRFDQLCGLFLIWLVSFLLLASLIGNLLLALGLSIPLFALEAMLLRKFLPAFADKRQARRNFWLNGQKFLDNISRMSTEEYKLAILELFSQVPHFSNVLRREEAEIDFSAVYREAPVAIKCLQSRITPTMLRSFVDALILDGYKNGILVTTAEYHLSVTRALKEISTKGIKIKLIDRYALMRLALRGEYGGRVAEADVKADKLVATKPRRQAVFTALSDSIFRFEKAKSYFLFGLLLYGGYMLMRDVFWLGLFYLLFALLNICLGLICLYLGRSIAVSDPLQGFQPEPDRE